MCKPERNRPLGDIHALCQDRNCSVASIRKVLHEAGPQVLERKDVFGRVPLFYAIRRRSSLPVIRALLDTFPGAILEADFCGDLPLYMLFGAQADHRVLQHVLDQDSSLAFFREKRFSGSHTLLQTICAQWVQVQKKELRKLGTPGTRTTTSTTSNNNQTVLPRSHILSDARLSNRWKKLVLMIRAAHRVVSTKKGDEDSCGNSDAATRQSHEKPELHIALQLGYLLPRAVIGQFIEVYPEQAAKPVLERRQREESKVDNQHSGHQKQHRSSTNSSSSRTSTSTTSTTSRLPLHLAISGKGLSWEEGLKALVYAHPSALFQHDHTTNLVPFLQQAACEYPCWNSVYCLLREDPSVLSRILADESRVTRTTNAS